MQIGTQSVGGGASTLYLMRAVLVDKRKWLTMRAFVEDWTVSRVSIGNHLTALAALVGHRIAGGRGAAIAIVGLLVPSGLITAALTGAFAAIRDQPAVQSALAGIAPVTIGMMLGISFVMVRTIISPRSWMLGLDVALFSAATAAGFLVSGSTIAIIIGGALIGSFFLGRNEVPRETIEG